MSFCKKLKFLKLKKFSSFSLFITKFFFFLLFVVIFLFWPQKFAYGCSCGLENNNETIDIILSIKDADVVFQGEVIESDNNFDTFKIEKLWKGNQKNTTTIQQGGNCSSFFDKYEHYLVYANYYNYGNEQRLQSSWCGRTMKIDDAQKDIKILRYGLIIFGAVIVGIFMLILLIVTLLLRHRHKKKYIASI